MTDRDSLSERNDSRVPFCQAQLTEWEWGVIQFLLDGKSNDQIALQLDICARAVEKPLTHIYKKIEVSGRPEAIIKLMHMFDN